MRNHESFSNDNAQEREIHDIYDDSYWEHKNPESVSIEELATIVGKTEEECIGACREAIDTGNQVIRDEGKYWLLGEEDEENGVFYGSVWMYPKNSKARFNVLGTSTHINDNGERVYIAENKFRNE